MSQKPHELDTRWVRREGKTAQILELVCAFPTLHLTDERGGTCVGPGNGIVEGLAGVFVPKNEGFTLVSDADGAYPRHTVAVRDELLDSLFYACLDGLEQLERVLFVPSAKG